jgi:predicted DNA-binding protein with PD1-like motif
MERSETNGITRRGFIAAGTVAVAVGAAGAGERAPHQADMPRVRVLADGDAKTYLLVFQTGQEVMKGLLAFAREHKLTAGHVTGIGAVSSAVIGYFDVEKKQYLRMEQNVQLEVLSLTGNLALEDEKPVFHVHVTLGGLYGTAIGGHLFEATARPTVELVLTTYSKPVRRKIDRATGLPVIDI